MRGKLAYLDAHPAVSERPGSGVGGLRLRYPMTSRFSIRKLALAAGVYLLDGASLADAGEQEFAELRATILPGPLEIETESVGLVYEVGGLQASGQEQVDAVQFELAGLVLNDLNGDGLGWRLVAVPEPLVLGSAQLPLGTVEGFSNFSEIAGLSTPGPNELRCDLADSIAGLSVDYSLRYTIPAFAPAGEYRGRVTFSIVAE